MKETIEVEVKKFKACIFICKEQHPNWLANVVSVMKKNKKVSVCIDFRNLNNTCPKDDIPLPITDVMINNTCGFERISCIDGFLDITKLKCVKTMKSIHPLEYHKEYTAIQ